MSPKKNEATRALEMLAENAGESIKEDHEMVFGPLFHKLREMGIEHPEKLDTLYSERKTIVIPSPTVDGLVHIHIRWGERTHAEVLGCKEEPRADNPWIDIAEVYRSRQMIKTTQEWEAIIPPQARGEEGRRVFNIPFTPETPQHIKDAHIQLPDRLVFALMPRSVQDKLRGSIMSIDPTWGMSLSIDANSDLTKDELMDVLEVLKGMGPVHLCRKLLDYFVGDHIEATKEHIDCIEEAWREEGGDRELPPTVRAQIRNGVVETLNGFINALDSEKQRPTGTMAYWDQLIFREIEKLKRLEHAQGEVEILVKEGRASARERWQVWNKQIPLSESIARPLWPVLFKNFFPSRWGVSVPVSVFIARMFCRNFVGGFNPALSLPVFDGISKTMFQESRSISKRMDANGQLYLVETRGGVTGRLARVVPNVPYIPDHILKGLSIKVTQTLLGQRLLRWVIRTAWEQLQLGVPDPRVIRIPGGDSALAKELGVSPSRRGDVKQMLEWMTYVMPLLPGEEHFGLLTTSLKKVGKGKERLITVGTALLPHFNLNSKKGTKGRHLVPVPAKEPPLFGRDQGKLVSLQWSVLSELRSRASELIEHGGVRITDRQWSELAEPLDIKPKKLKKILEVWTDDEEPFLRVIDDDRYTLTEHHKEDLDFLMKSGKQSRAGRRGGRKAAKKNEKFTK